MWCIMFDFMNGLVIILLVSSRFLLYISVLFSVDGLLVISSGLIGKLCSLLLFLFNC